MKCILLGEKNSMTQDKDLLHDLHNYSCNLDTREIFLHNTYNSEDNSNPGVEYKMSNMFLKNIRALELKSDNPIIVHMQSIGGEWADGMAIFDAIAMSRCFVTIIAYGQAESMSSIILQAGDRRLITPNTYFMSHFGSTAAAGEYMNVQNWVKYEKYLCDIMLDIYAKQCVKGLFFKEKYGKNPPVSKIKNFLNTKLKSGDWFINAKDAVYYGFADEIIETWQKLN
jgi:ATP-dependent protease ClpP protease subunit